MKKKLTYTFPDGSKTVRIVNTNEKGAYRERYTTDILGTWSITASSESDIYYEASSSDPTSFNVEKPSILITIYIYILLPATIILTAIWWQRKRKLKAGLNWS